jgi:hypothetical protein
MIEGKEGNNGIFADCWQMLAQKLNVDAGRVRKSGKIMSALLFTKSKTAILIEFETWAV